MDLRTAAERTWRRLPVRVRAHLGPPLRRLMGRSTPAAAVAPAANGERDPEVEVVSTLDELDAKLKEIDQAALISDDVLRAMFRTFEMKPPTSLPRDPYSREYLASQLDLYYRISGRSAYSVANELNDFEMTPGRPFPYYTESADTVGNQLMAIGYIIKTMGLPAKAKILDLGAGWGNTSIQLARMGYEVHAIDIDPKFVKLIMERAELIGVPIQASALGFLDIDSLDQQFDAVLFFESFHHCSDHQALLTKLTTVLVEGGRVFFAAEPITPTFPQPWGLRLDGESLWAIRRYGWFELGFRDSYFLRTLQRGGWVATKHLAADTYLGQIYEARRANGLYEVSTFHMPPDEDATWAEAAQDRSVGLRYSGGRTRLTVEAAGPYESIEVEGINPSPKKVPFRLRHGSNAVRGEAAPDAEFFIRLGYDPSASTLLLRSGTWSPNQVMGSADARRLGLGIRSVRLVTAGI